MKAQHLFIGGSCDGKMREVRDAPHLVMVRVPIEEGKFRQEQYQATHLRDLKGIMHTVYAFVGVDAVKAMMQKYRTAA